MSSQVVFVEIDKDQINPIKPADYSINEDQTEVRFYPSIGGRTNWTRKINGLEIIQSILYARGGLIFKGPIDVFRFIEAMKETVHDSHFLFSRFHIKEDGTYLSYSTTTEDNIYVQLEIERNPALSVDTAILESVIPDKIINEKMRNGYVEGTLEGLPLIVYKLTILSDGFGIGYSANHSFLDRASIFYLIKYISHMYTYGREKLTLKKPVLVELIDKNQTYKDKFNTLSEVRKFAELVRFSHAKKDSAPTTTNNNNILLEIKFNPHEILKLRKQLSTQQQHFSINDFINAVIMKIYSFNTNLKDTEEFNLRFACNMRKHCNIPEEFIAILVHLPGYSLKLADIRKKTILELAMASRQCILDMNVEEWKINACEFKAWVEGLVKLKENISEYITSPEKDPYSCRITNVSAFPYDKIRFDDTQPYSIKSPNMTHEGLHIILYETNNNQKEWTCLMNVPLSNFNAIEELGKTTKLFSFVERSKSRL